MREVVETLGNDEVMPGETADVADDADGVSGEEAERDIRRFRRWAVTSGIRATCDYYIFRFASFVLSWLGIGSGIWSNRV